MGRAKRVGRGILAGLGAFMLLISIADIPAKVAIWAGWFKALAPRLHTLTGRWILGLLGISIALLPWAVEWFNSVRAGPTTKEPLPPSIDIQVTPDNGPKPEQYLDVTNQGEQTLFRAYGQIVSADGTPNAYATGKFSLGWSEAGMPAITIPKHAHGKILVATFEDIVPHSFFQMSIKQLNGNNGFKERDMSRWYAGDKVLPLYRLEVTIIADGTENPWVGQFSLTPETNVGPLKMEEAGVPA
jgi:hypothetical protein